VHGELSWEKNIVQHAANLFDHVHKFGSNLTVQHSIASVSVDNSGSA